MKKNKYPISREFFPFYLYTPNISREGLTRINKIMKPPRSLYRDRELSVQSYMIPGYKEGMIELMVMTPVGVRYPAPCFLNIHGGGFVMDASPAHYRHAVNYAKGAECVVAFVRYRLGPEYPFPYPQEDSYKALEWIHAHAAELNIDPENIGIGGDSAGGMLAVTACMMARDRGSGIHPRFQLLVYPFLDNRGISESYRTFTDTPMWNSTLSRKVREFIDVDPGATPLQYKSPVEAESLAGLPPAYVEVAEFDALRDDGILYSRLLQDEGIEVEFHSSQGTMHGFDYVSSAPTTRRMEALRIDYMKRKWR